MFVLSRTISSLTKIIGKTINIYETILVGYENIFQSTIIPIWYHKQYYFFVKFI